MHFKTPADANAHYFGWAEASVDDEPLPSVEELSLSETRSTAIKTESQNMTVVTTDWLKNLSGHEQLEGISKLFQSYVLVHYSVTLPCDFLELAARAMAQLKQNQRSNILYQCMAHYGITVMAPAFL